MTHSPDSSPLKAAVREALADTPRVSFALVFGSAARGVVHANSDVDVAIEFGERDRPTPREVGALVSRLEEKVGRRVDVVILDEAAPGLAYRVFRDGEAVLVRDRAALVERKARAILEYLDFQPTERTCSEAVLSRRTG